MLKHRIQSGLLLGLSLLAGIFFLNPWAVLVVLLAVCGLALVEFYSLLDARQIPHFKIVGVLCGLALVAGTWLASQRSREMGVEIEALLLFLALGAVFFRQILFKGSERPWETMAGSFLGVLYVAFLFNFIVKLLVLEQDHAGRLLLLYLVTVVKFTDMGAYFVGCAIGRHKLIPRISPAKSWEGVIGGVLTGMAASVAYMRVLDFEIGRYQFQLHDALIIGVALAVAGVVGDLIESLLKRASGVKDSGTIILGMGGVLDVLDSLLFAAPVLYLYVRFLL
jgi:phosphatidate cytidylyltransferase